MLRPAKRQRPSDGKNKNNNNRLQQATSSQQHTAVASIVVYKNGTTVIETPIASTWIQEIFMERFRKEILEKFSFSLSNKIQQQHYSEDDTTELVLQQQQQRRLRRNVLQQRMVFGINAVTKTLEQQQQTTNTTNLSTESSATSSRWLPPKLIVLTGDDAMVPPPSLVSHIPIVCRKWNIPILLLRIKEQSSIDDGGGGGGSSSSSRVLGRLLGAKHVTAMAFLPKHYHDKDPITHYDTSFVSSEQQKSSNATTDDHESTERVHQAVDSFVEFIIRKLESEE
jgi:ribosomal protein L7Ae-like RNA K-turn-binding protein